MNLIKVACVAIPLVATGALISNVISKRVDMHDAEGSTPSVYLVRAAAVAEVPYLLTLLLTVVYLFIAAIVLILSIVSIPLIMFTSAGTYAAIQLAGTLIILMLSIYVYKLIR